MAHRQQLDKLEPGFDDCPSPCKFAEDEGRTVDLPDLCGACEVRTQFGFFREAVEQDIARRFPDGCAWSFELLYAEAARLTRVAARTGESSYPAGCDALTAACLDILRREEMRPQRIARWEAMQQRGTNGK